MDTLDVSVTIEVCADNDGDVTPDFIDLDDDNDGIPDTVEGKRLEIQMEMVSLIILT